jgi:threonyl-tRNA synthetase
MSAIKITLPDGKVLEFEQEPTVLEVATRIGAGLAKGTLGAKLNGTSEIVDLRSKLKDGTKLEIVSTKSADAKEVIRHSAAHVMAQAVQEIWPEVKVTIGPVIETGFYYDFDSPFTFTPEDLEKIEKKMGEIVARDLPIVREDWPIDKAIATFGKMGETFKVELIEDLKTRGETTVGIYHQGPWFDLCRGPHIQKTGQIKAFKVMSIAGAYWRGDEKRAQLQRIYATAFGDKKELEIHLSHLEEAKKRDHRKLGKELGLFMFHASAPGSPFFTGRGTILYNELVNYIRSIYSRVGYQEVITPQVFSLDLFKTSGHYQNYRENMYFTQVEEKEEQQSGLKPMNCPSHCMIFQHERHSYRELPIRMADFGRLHRFERSGVMHGLTRVRTFCQDDAHIFCTENQMNKELHDFMAMAQEVYGVLGMTNWKVLIATRPEKRMGSDETWDKAESALFNAMKSLNIPYSISPGDGAFYGPKVEIHFVDAIGRSWQLGTVQVDYMMPEAFGLEYVGEDNTAHRPVMLHRAILGSLERFIGIYIEHCAAHFPTWLAPRQVAILNVTDRQTEYCKEIQKTLQALGLRAEFDDRSEKLGFKIREAQIAKIPYMLIIGDQEVENRTVSVRLKTGANLSAIPLEKFVFQLNKEVKERALNSSFVAPENGQAAKIENLNQEKTN